MEPLLSRPVECPRCHRTFACCAGDILNCECNTVPLTSAVRHYIAQHYTDCLCAKCLDDIQKECRDKQASPAVGKE